jgi:hypothetical protein
MNGDRLVVDFNLMEDIIIGVIILLPFFIAGSLILVFRKQVAKYFQRFSMESFKRNPWMRHFRKGAYKNLNDMDYWYKSVIKFGIFMIIAAGFFLVMIFL